jgi:hypothetical protein
MHNDYADIRERIASEPIWFDENAVPRYCEFDPDEMANIYACEAVLAVVECQGCKKSFRVACSELNLRDKIWDPSRNERIAFLSDLIVRRSLQYGDPPNTNCCREGPTMNSALLEVVEYWHKPYVKLFKPGDMTTDLKAMEWTRDASLQRMMKTHT